MNVLILAAGYATRLHPLTLHRAKPLLEVAGKPMMEWVLDNLAPMPGIESVYVVTNNKFAPEFEEWAQLYMADHGGLPIHILNDGSNSDADKLGAIGDIQLAIHRAGLAESDLVVVAGDNLFSQSLRDFGVFSAEHAQPVLGVYDVGCLEQACKYGVVSVNQAGDIASFEEKPLAPRSTLIGIALYYYPKDVLGAFETYLREGNNPDQPGRFVQWLHTRMPVKTWSVPGTWFDVGSHETLDQANHIFANFREQPAGLV